MEMLEFLLNALGNLRVELSVLVRDKRIIEFNHERTPYSYFDLNIVTQMRFYRARRGMYRNRGFCRLIR